MHVAPWMKHLHDPLEILSKSLLSKEKSKHIQMQMQTPADPRGNIYLVNS